MILIFIIPIHCDEFEEIFSNEIPFGMIEQIDNYQNQKLVLSECTPEDLAKLPGLDFSLANQIIQLYKQGTADIQTIIDTLNISGFQSFVINNCITESKNEDRKIFLRQRFSPELVPWKKNSDYGSYFDNYTRLDQVYGKNQFSILSKRSSGDRLLFENIMFTYSYKDRNNELYIGDYSLSSGLGSILNTGFGRRKMIGVAIDQDIGSISNINRSSYGLSGFRGISYKHRFFFDHYTLDQDIAFALTDRDGSISNNTVQSLFLNSSYTNFNDWNKRSRIKETMYYINTLMKFNKYSINFSLIQFNIDRSLDDVGNNYFFSSNTLLFSLSQKIEYRNKIISFELGGNSKNLNFVGQYSQFNPIFNFDLQFRYLSDSTNTAFTNIISENYNNRNEYGILLNGKIRTNRNLITLFLIDNYWGSKSISNEYIKTGFQSIIQFEHRLVRSFKTIFRTSYEIQNRTIQKDHFKEYDSEKIRIRIDEKFKIRKNLNLSFRIERSFLNELGNNYTGALNYIKLKYTMNENYKFDIKYSVFSIENYQVALWEFDQWGRGNIRSQGRFGEGSRFFININYMSNNILLSLSYANTFYNRKVEILNNGIKKEVNENELILQLDYNL